MNTVRFVSSVAIAIVCSACGSEPSLAFPPDTPMEVAVLAGSGEIKRWSVEASDPRYKEMHEWLARNQNGWSAYFATPPGRGVLVTAGDLRIQFIAAGALACVKGVACRHKAVMESEYGFLLR